MSTTSASDKDPFASSKYLIERAKHHIGDLDRQSVEFFNSNPRTDFVEFDPDTSLNVHKTKFAKPLPVALNGIAFDTVNNLRSALDQAVFVVTKKPKTLFSFAPTKSDFENNIKGWHKNTPQEIVDVMRRAKPYKGGNNLLWALNELANTNKHSFIVPVMVFTGRIVYKKMSSFGGGAILNAPVWDRTKNEMELFRIRPGAALNVDLDIAACVTLCDIEFVDGQPAVAVLNEMVNIVQGIVMAIEAEALRLGLV